MAFSTNSGKGPQSDINVTPLVDVVLVLLIIFMVVTPLLQVGIDAQIPKPDDSPPDLTPPAVTQVVVAVHEDGSIWLNADKVDEQQLSDRVKNMMRGRSLKEKVAFVSGTDNLQFGKIVSVMDILKGSGVADVGIMDPLTP